MGLALLHAHLLSAAGGTHRVEIHLSKAVPEGVQALLSTLIAIAMLLAALLVLVGTRGKHPGWVGLDAKTAEQEASKSNAKLAVEIQALAKEQTSKAVLEARFKVLESQVAIAMAGVGR